MKPIAVLLLVLVAVGALIFGLMTLGGGREGDTPSPGLPDATATAPKLPARPTEFERAPEAPARRAGTVSSQPERNPIGDFVYTNELRVQVVDSQKRPIPDVEVTLTTLSSNDLFFQGSTGAAYELGPLRTGPDGRVSFLGIEPSHSSYTLVCMHPDYARVEQPTLPIEPEGVQEEPPIELITGATLQGTVKDEQGGPIAGAKLLLEGLLAQEQESRAPDRLEAVSDAGGAFAIKNVPRGVPRSLSVSAAGFGRKTFPGQNFPDTNAKTFNVVLRTAEMISGRVVGVGNQALPKAKVMAVCAEGTLQNSRGDAETDENGEFRFESLDPGEYSVYATLKGWRFQQQNRIRTNTANLVLEGTRMATVCGQVVDAASGAPITQFSLQLRTFIDASTPTTPLPETKASIFDGSGNFCLEGVEASGYVVEAWAVGYAPTHSQDFVVSNDRNVEHVAVRLTHGGSISGRLVDPDKQPIEKGLIRTKPNDWIDDDFTKSFEDEYPSNVTQTETRSGPDGSFVLKNLSPDQYQLLFEGSFSNVAKADVAVTEGTNTNLGDLTMARGGTLVGTVFDSTGKVVPGAGIMFGSTDDNGPHVYQTRTGADGKFKVRHVAQGRYLVHPIPPTSGNANPLEELRIGGDAERQITIVDGQEFKLDLTLPVTTHQAVPQPPIPPSGTKQAQPEKSAPAIKRP